MTLQSVGGVFYPDYSAYGTLMNGNTTYNSFLIDAAAEKVAFILRCPKAGNLARVGFRTNTVTTADALKVSFQDVSLTNGDPDGNVDQFRTIASGSVTSNTWLRTGLITSDGTDGGTKRTVARGELLAVVIEFNAFVAGVVNIAANGVFGNSASVPMVGTYYLDHFTAAWAKSTVSVITLALEYDDGTFAYIPNSFPGDTKNQQNYNSGSTPDEVALRFSVPFKCRAGGFWGSITIAGDTDIVLYDGDGTTPLATVSLDKDVRTVNNASLTGVFTSDVSLQPNTFYRLSVKPTTVTNSQVSWFTVNATPGTAQLDQLSGGQDAHWSQRTDAGAWSDDATKRPAIGLILSALDDGQGGGLSRARVVNAGGM